jgi:hypothetical protein
MRGNKLPVAGMLFVSLFAVYLITFRIPSTAVWLTSAYFILVIMLGQATRLFLPGVESSLFRAWLLPALSGLGLFQLIWFLAKVMHLHHLILMVPLALLSAALALKIKPGNIPQARDRKRGSVWIVTALLLCAAITYFPFKNFGRERDGSYHYRASFWAVSMKHLAVVNTLSRDYPFANPYFQGEPLHYYYLTYAFPAALKESGLTARDAVFGYQAVQAYLFVLLCFFFFQMQTEKKRQPFLLTLILIFSVSVEGLYYICRHFSRFLENPLFFRNLVHFDGVSNVLFSQPPMDTLHRAILFTPMHLEALTFLMLGLMFVKRSRFPLASAAMAFSFLSSFFIGGVGFLILGIYLLLTLPSGRFSRSSLISLASSATLSLVFVKATAMLGSVSSTVSFVFPQASKLLWIIGLNFGPVFILALIAYPLEWKKNRDVFTAALFISLILAVILSFFLRIEPLGNEFPLKLSLILQLLLVAGLAPLGRFRKFFAVAALVIIVAGLPTFLGDIYCAQDISSVHTLKVPVGEMNMARWIDRNLDGHAVIQTYPSAREWFFSIVPVFAGRDMLVGDAMHGIAFQVAPEAYERRRQEAELALAHINEPEYREYLRKSGLTHVFFGAKEAERMPIPSALKLVKKTAGTSLYALE